MRWVKSFVQFWYDFVVGDDWVMALGVVAAIAITELVASSISAAWLITPLVVTVMLGVSLGRAQSTHTPEDQGDG